jgi:hypothetical protein
MPENSMKIIQKWEDMAMYLYEAVRSYPKNEKFVLAAKTTDVLVDIGTDFVQANSISNRAEKRRLIEHADRGLVKLQVLVRMGMLRTYLPMKKYEIFSGQVLEIGKMVGGWLKSVNNV